MTDDGRVFTGRFFAPPVEVLWDRICRENGVEHRLTQPRSPTTTGKIERFHRTLRAEFDTTRVFTSLRAAQGALDERVDYYNTQRPHQGVDDQTPQARYTGQAVRQFAAGPAAPTRAVVEPPRAADRDGDGWVSRKVGANGVVCVAWQQVSVGKQRAGSRCDVFVTDDVLQFWVGPEQLKTVSRTSTGEVRKENAAGTGRSH